MSPRVVMTGAARAALSATALWALGCSDASSTPATGADATSEADTSGSTDTSGDTETGGCTTAASCDPGALCVDGACAACTEDGDCAPDYGAGATCSGGACASACVPGAVGCACADDACTNGRCEAGVCVACNADAVGCACEAPTGCSGGLVCDGGTALCRGATECADAGCAPNQRCTEATGGADARCEAECEDGYTWDGSACQVDAAGCDPTDPDGVAAACAAEHRKCVEGADGPACGDCEAGTVESAGACVALKTCEAIADSCAAVFKGCAEGDGTTNAACAGCLSGYVAAGDSCEPKDTCATIGAACTGAHKACVEGGDNSDATCGDCLEGYVADAVTGDCAADPELNCIAGDVKSIASDCEALHRSCDDPDDAPASCGACADGYAEVPATGLCAATTSCEQLGCDALGRLCAEGDFSVCLGCKAGLSASDPDDAMSECVSPVSCLELSCGDDEFCVESESGGNGKCVTSPCGDGQAQNSSGKCVSCLVTCALVSGETGRLWPYTREGSDDCVCETQTGWFLTTTGAALPQECDADGDGWVRQSASGFLSHPDDAIRNNARCNVRTIDRVALQNEWGQELEIKLCKAAGEPSAISSGSCTTPNVISLYEPTALDDDASVAEGTQTFPTYTQGGVGRRLRAAELNPLTRACVTALGDFNGNNIVDLAEGHEMSVPNGVTLTDTQSALLDFGYFMELHHSWYEDNNGTPRLVIAERSRCDTNSASADAFFLGYDEGSDYWRECSRRRRASFSGSGAPGYDFATWACDDSSGACDVPPIPTTETVGTETPAHGLCEVALPPADGVWRGMLHHSQFRCVQVANIADDDTEVATADLYAGTVATQSAKYQFNSCNVACPAGDASCSQDCSSGTCAASSLATPETGDVSSEDNPRTPVLSCTQSVPSAGSVGFIAVRYQDAPTSYSEGCIDEWQEWPQLCPGYEANPDGAVGDGAATQFGQLTCGCGEAYGGTECDVGCPYANVATGYSYSPRVGFWMCAHTEQAAVIVANSTYGNAQVGTKSGATWVMRATIARTPIATSPLCESESCDTGWALY